LELINYGMIAYVLSSVLMFEGGFLAIPAIIGFANHEQAAFAYLYVAIGSFTVGILGRLRKPGQRGFYALEGLVTVSLSWILMSLVGALALFLTGEYPSYVDSLFECVSGFTTTGAGVLTDIECLSVCNLFWRCFTHWIGGMGVLVFLMAILPLSGRNTIHMMRAEAPGPEVGKIVPRVRTTAKILYEIYIGITILEIIILKITGMNLFEATTISFSTVGTGGFALLNSSIASYSMSSQIVIIVFMLMCSLNFYVYYLVITGKIKEAVKNEEVIVFLIIVFAATMVISVSARGNFNSFGEAFHNSLFTVSSLISTTGFGIGDYDSWPILCQSTLLTIMLIGACAGSTGGGLKISRFLIIGKSIRNYAISVTHPRSVRRVRFNGKVLSDTLVKEVLGYFAIYIFVLIGSFLLICVDNYDIATSLSAVITTLNNVGPGVNAIGLSGNFAHFSDFSKMILTLDMLIGRLEIFPILVLFIPRTWKKK